MAATVEPLEKLARRMTFEIAAAAYERDVEKRLRAEAKNLKIPGFRPGKVPLNMVAAKYGAQIRQDVLNAHIDAAFHAGVETHQLRVAGRPLVRAKENPATENAENAATSVQAFTFDATFEVYPDAVPLCDFSALALEKYSTEVLEEDVEKTLLALRKQRLHYHEKPQDAIAAVGDRVMVDFVGTMEGQAFENGSAKNHYFILGEQQMLPDFETPIVGSRVGEVRNFSFVFPADYKSELANKTADFTVTVQKIETVHLPALDDDFARSLGFTDGGIEKMRNEIRAILTREGEKKILEKHKNAVMEALLAESDFDIPKVLVDTEFERLARLAKQHIAKMGIDLEAQSLPPDLSASLNAQAQRRVRLGLIVTEIAKNQSLQVTNAQLHTFLAQATMHYENPGLALANALKDQEQCLNAHAALLEEKVVDYVLSQAKVTEKNIPFSVLMQTDREQVAAEEAAS